MHEAAAHVFVSPARFQQLIAEGTIPRAERGGYDLDDVRRRCFERLRAVASARGSSLKLSDERALLAQSQRRYHELRTARLAGELVSIEDVAEEVEDEYGICRQKLLSIAPSTAPQLVGLGDLVEITRIINERIYEVMNELSEPERIIEEAHRKGGVVTGRSGGARTGAAKASGEASRGRVHRPKSRSQTESE
jgi:hypothetical protein